MDSATVRAKVNEHAERLSRLTAGDRRKAEAEDRAFLAESLGGETSSVFFFFSFGYMREGLGLMQRDRDRGHLLYMPFLPYSIAVIPLYSDGWLLPITCSASGDLLVCLSPCCCVCMFFFSVRAFSFLIDLVIGSCPLPS